jgi:ferredoxin
MKISIDLDRCAGHGRCAVEAPKIIAIDPSEGTAVALVADVPEDEEKAALRACAACPEQAVIVASYRSEPEG